MAAVTLLETQDLTRHFGGLRAVDGIDFVLPEGEVRALIGPNGAGKTTFVSLISGRLRPSAGTIRFAGRDITRLPAFERVRLGIAYTFQITSVFQNLSVVDNARLAAESRRGGRDAERLTHAVLAEVGLAGREADTAGALAYGHQRLLEVAMGLALQPRLLILDEPTQGLSDGEIDGFITLVKAISAKTTVLIIEHNMRVVMALADRITVLDHGRVLADGPPAQIRADRAVQAAYLGGG